MPKRKRNLPEIVPLTLTIEQLHDIEKSNYLLLSKIKNIEKRQNQKFKKPSFLTTLNSKIMKEANEEIFKQNRRICQKIMSSEAFYKTKSILQKSNNLERVLHNISFNARRVQSAKSLAHSSTKISRPSSCSLRRPQSSIPRSQSKSEFLLKVKESRLTRPESAPSIKKHKPFYEQNPTDEKQVVGTLVKSPVDIPIQIQQSQRFC